MVKFVCKECKTKFNGNSCRNPDFTSAIPNDCCKDNCILLPITVKDRIPGFDKMFYRTAFNDVTTINHGGNYEPLGYFPDNLPALEYLRYVLKNR